MLRMSSNLNLASVMLVFEAYYQIRPSKSLCLMGITDFSVYLSSRLKKVYSASAAVYTASSFDDLFFSSSSSAAVVSNQRTGQEYKTKKEQKERKGLLLLLAFQSLTYLGWKERKQGKPPYSLFSSRYDTEARDVGLPRVRVW